MSIAAVSGMLAADRYCKCICNVHVHACIWLVVLVYGVVVCDFKLSCGVSLTSLGDIVLLSGLWLLFAGWRRRKVALSARQQP